MANQSKKLDLSSKEGRQTFARMMAEEGIVLLENRNSVLPLGREKVALFGRTQIDSFKGGTGSANSISEYSVSIQDGLRDCGVNLEENLASAYNNWVKENPLPDFGYWGSGMHSNPEMPVDVALAREAKRNGAKKAIIVVGRTAGENEDTCLVKGDYYLSDEEREMFAAVTKVFKKTIVILNIGNVMDLNFIEEYGIDGVLYMNMAGMEGGHAIGNVIKGKTPPSGHLTATFAKSYDAYPSSEYFGQTHGGILQDYKEDIFVGYRYFETFEGANDQVIYPFGYGLSYADFAVSDIEYYACTSKIHVTMTVTNISEKYKGKYVAQVYYGAPQMGTGEAKLGKPSKVLGGWAKTKELAPGKSQTIKIVFPIKSMASFDDTGVTGRTHKSCWVLEAGDYTIYAGDNVMNAVKVGTYTRDKLKVVERCHHLPTALSERLLADGSFEKLDTIPVDPVKGLQVPAVGRYEIPVKLSASADFENGGCLCAMKKGQSVTYNLNVGSSGRYEISFVAGRDDGRRFSDIADVVIDGAKVTHLDMPIVKGESESRIIILPMDKYSFTITAKEDFAPINTIILSKVDSTVQVKADVENYIGSEQYCESSYRVVTKTFADDGTGKACTCLVNMRRPGCYSVFKLNVERGGTYDLSFDYARYQEDATINDCVAIFVSNVGQSIDDVMIYNTIAEKDAPVHNLRRSEPVQIALPNGECYLKLVSSTKSLPDIAAIILKSNNNAPARKIAGSSSTKTDELKPLTVGAPNVYEELTNVEKKGIQLEDVYKDMSLMEAFLDQLSNKELAILVSGTSKNVTAVGTSGTSQRLPERGVPAGQTADGPLGLRLNANTTSYPSGTLLASSWDVELAHTYGLAIGEEAKELGVDMWLAPGLNIHRDPRCGRNFEYYSEDPLVAGKITANIARGTQEHGVATTAKHYAVNNTEHERLKSNSRISARAMREIYLKGFEIAIKEGDPWCIMSSYNLVNNIKVSETPALITDLPRDEWGWTGMFMTDWGNGANHVQELHAGHDLKMSNGDVNGVTAALDSGELSREEVKICAARVLTMIMKTNAFLKTLDK